MFEILKTLLKKITGEETAPEKPAEKPPKVTRTYSYRPAKETGKKEKAGKKTKPKSGKKKAPVSAPISAPAPPKPKPAPKRKKAPKPAKKPSHPPAKSREDADSRVNKHGIPVFHKKTDFSSIFKEDIPPPPAEPPVSKPPIITKKKKPPAKSRIPGRQVSKHGFPIFRKDEDLSPFFRDDTAPEARRERPPSGASQAKPSEPDFSTLLEAALSGKKREEMLLAKKGDPPASGPMTKKQIVRSFPPPQAVLDLHGNTGEEAVTETDRFIRQALFTGKRTVMLIVGKGIHSEGRAVLPDIVETLIVEMKRKNQVLAFEWEKGKKRKSGAMVVYLNSRA